MSCQHGNPLGACDLCDELLAEFRDGKKDGWEACEACHGIVDGKHTEAESLRQQLAAIEKQNVMLRGALHGVVLATDPCVMVRYATEVLAATADLKDCILCDAEPVGFFELNDYANWDHNTGDKGTPLYKARTK